MLNIPLVYLFVQVGNAVLNSEDIHQLLAERAGNSSAEKRISVLFFCQTILTSGVVPPSALMIVRSEKGSNVGSETHDCGRRPFGFQSRSSSSSVGFILGKKLTLFRDMGVEEEEIVVVVAESRLV